jgi:amino acid adenylation domain-containing protein
MQSATFRAQEYPKHQTLPLLFERQVIRTPLAVAASFRGEILTYANLNRRANQLARYLRDRGIRPGSLVGISMERSLDMAVGLVGIVKAGGAYVPLDPEYPTDRIAWMLEDSRVQVLITQSRLMERFAGFGETVVCVDRDGPSICREDTANVSAADAGDRAYVMYTSGSAGWPKGVEIAHRSVVNLVDALRLKIGMTADDALLSASSMSFDIQVADVWTTLATGARLVLASAGACKDGVELGRELDACGATVMEGTPSTWRLLLDSGWQGRQTLTAVCGGEILPVELAERLRDKVKALWNAYGPTETTVWSAAHLVGPGDDIVPIGRPLNNTQFFVLDEQQQPVPACVPGELYIGGEGLALGYLNQPELTKERFIRSPFDGYRSRLYRTGDRVRQRDDGAFEFLGRLDRQVKLRGYRIELDEISSVLSRHPEVQEATTTLCEPNGGNCYLVAHVVQTPGSPTNDKDLKSFLRTKLPEYMVPSRVSFLKALPRLPNGKLDQRVLSSPEFLELQPDENLSSPHDAIEQGLADIFEELLGIHPIGTKQSFFDLGGNSLLIAGLLVRVEQIFGKALPLAKVMQAPTIEQLAPMLRNYFGPPSLPGVIPIQTEGSGPPLICLGAGHGFLTLSRLVGGDRPFLGLDLALLDPAQLPIPYGMEHLAAQVAATIRTLQPSGPYYVGGWCRFGPLAYETARHMMARGEEVALLTLIDSPNPAYYRALPTAAKMHLGVERLRYHLSNLRWLRAAETPQYILDRLRTLRYKVGKHCLRLSTHGGMAGVEQILHVASAGYQPPPYQGRVALFQAMERPPGPHWDLRFGWRELVTGHLAAFDIPGGHEGMFQEPHVQLLACRMRECLSLT